MGLNYVSEEASAPGNGETRATGAAWSLLRQSLYMLLLAVRVPLQLLFRLTAFPLICVAVFWGFAAGWASPACFWSAGAGVGLLVAGFLFDTLLLRLAPEHLYLDS